MLEMCTKCLLSGDLRISNIPKFFAERRPSDVNAHEPLIIELDTKLNQTSWSNLFTPIVKMSELPDGLREDFPAALAGISPLWMPSDVLINCHGLRVQLAHTEKPEFFEFRLSPNRARNVKLTIKAYNLRQEPMTYIYNERSALGNHNGTPSLTQYLPQQKLRYTFAPAADGVNTELSICQLR